MYIEKKYTLNKYLPIFVNETFFGSKSHVLYFFYQQTNISVSL